jgi:hypothetical protein
MTRKKHLCNQPGCTEAGLLRIPDTDEWICHWHLSVLAHTPEAMEANQIESDLLDLKMFRDAGGKPS